MKSTELYRYTAMILETRPIRHVYSYMIIRKCLYDPFLEIINMEVFF